MHSTTSPTDIAIIGMSALLPGAKNLQAYWENILNKVNAVHDAPDKWSGSYYEPNSTDNTRIYTRKGGFLGDLAQFDPLEFGIMPNAVDGGDPDHFLALKLAQDALQDAGYVDTNKLSERKNTGIILGRGTYINRGFVTALQQSMMLDQTLDLLHQLQPELDSDKLASIRQEIKTNLPPLNTDIIPALVPNVVTGRIANRLDLMGPNYLVDAACSSSLIAVELAIKELLSDRCDMMLAGGVQAATPAPIYMFFCQLGALSHTDIKPFDQSAQGTLLGEGIGFLVLKRLADAKRDGDRIYAVIKGVGIASDGKALGLLAPRIEGEVLALQRAYQETGVNPNTIGLIEAHGTGIPLGDKTEIQAMTQVFGQRQGKLPRCALGSVKSMIGHCIPAAGIASLIKTTLALYHKILPPTICEQVNPDLELEKTPFYINTQARPWIHGNKDVPRRAAVNAFGFGGINSHAILEEDTEDSPNQAPLLTQNWSTELLLFSGNNHQELITLINYIQALLQVAPQTCLADLAYTLAQRPTKSHRLAIVAKDISELQIKIKLSLEKLTQPKRTRIQTRNGIYYAIEGTIESGKTAFLFPGEGSQYTNMLADLCLHIPKLRSWFDFSDQTFSGIWEYLPSQLIFPAPTCLTDTERHLIKDGLVAIDIATEAVFSASIALYQLLTDFGIKPDVMLGHSTGEHTAIVASGVAQVNHKTELINRKRHLNQIYQNLELADQVPRGALLTAGAIDPSSLKELLDTYSGRIHLAMDNCPNQVVLFGSQADIDAAANQIKAYGGICMQLPFDRAYHTPLFAEVGTALHAYYEQWNMGSGDTPLYSCASCEAFPSDPEAIRNLAVKQWSSTVRFRETIEKLYAEGVRTFIEVGPSSNLTGFVDDTLRHHDDYIAIASNSQRKSGLEQIQHLLARLFVDGKTINMSPLYNNRKTALISLDPAISNHSLSKSTQTLDLTLPVMQLRSHFIETIQNKLQPQPTVIAPNFNSNPNPDLTVNQSNLPISEAIPNTQQSDEQTRLAILSAHFDLMQEFLASQARVTSDLFSHLNDGHSP